MRRVSSVLFLTLLLMAMLPLAFNIQSIRAILAIYTFEVEWAEIVFYVVVKSNSSVSHFNFSQPTKEIGFNVWNVTTSQIAGFCNVTIPKQLLNGPWTVLINAQPVLYFAAVENETHSFLYFTYAHSTHEVRIIGTYVIGSTIIVPDDYGTIQEAINAASDGDTVFVRNGIYYEHLVVNKTVSLVGEDKETTIIDGNYTGDAVFVTASNVSIQGFTIFAPREGGSYLHGVYLNNTDHCVVTNNIFPGTSIGIRIQTSSNNTIFGNSITNNEQWGIYLIWALDNSIFENSIANNGFGATKAGIKILWSSRNSIFHNNIEESFFYGITCEGASNNYIFENNITRSPGYGMGFFMGSIGNFIYHNNFIDNNSGHVDGGGGNTWENGSVGNYWDDYNGDDLDGDGIGDTNLPWKGVDYYPLMNVFWRSRFYWNPGDVNHDLEVNLFDAVRTLIAYSSETEDDNWNPHCDIAEPYGKIDLYDVVLVLVNYGEEYS